MIKRRELIVAASAALTAVAPRVALSQTFTKPIRLIVPFAPGGSTDVIARAISDSLGRALGQTIVVENKGGAGGAIGTMEAVRSAPDGHTLVILSPSVTAANPAINPKVPYDPLADLTPIMNMAAAPTVLAVNPGFPAKNYREFLAELKNKPGRYSYASGGTGGILHLWMEVFKSITGTFITHIPYRGAGPAVADVVGGQVHIAFDGMPSIAPFVRDGRLVPIVIAAPQRIKDLPDVPTFKEVGVDPLARMLFTGIAGPKGMKPETVQAINVALKQVLEEPAVRKRIEDTGTVIVASTPQEFATEMRVLLEQCKRIVAERKLTTD